MAWDYRPDRSGHYRIRFFSISEEELKLIKPLIVNRLKEAKKRVVYYLDIHDIGEATPFEEDIRYKWEEVVETL